MPKIDTISKYGMHVYCSRALSSPRCSGGSYGICTGPSSNSNYAKYVKMTINSSYFFKVQDFSNFTIIICKLDCHWKPQGVVAKEHVEY